MSRKFGFNLSHEAEHPEPGSLGKIVYSASVEMTRNFIEKKVFRRLKFNTMRIDPEIPISFMVLYTKVTFYLTSRAGGVIFHITLAGLVRCNGCRY